ncbi:MAG: hypothetical protein ACLUIQ_02050 [Dialister invisus]
MRSRRHWEKGNGTVMEIFGMDGTSRQRKAFFAALVGLIINLILGMVKIFAGWQSGFLSVIGDGFNNITDVGAVILLMMTFIMRQSHRIKNILSAMVGWSMSILL